MFPLNKWRHLQISWTFSPRQKGIQEQSISLLMADYYDISLRKPHDLFLLDLENSDYYQFTVARLHAQAWEFLQVTQYWNEKGEHYETTRNQ
jgi:hypothetical protein